MRLAGMLWGCVVLLVAARPAAAVTQENFQLRTGNDLVALCTVDKDDPMGAAAIHMCHGFGVGAYQMIQALTRHEKMSKLVCPPNPAPSRNEAVAAFVVWAHGHTELLGNPPAEVVGRYLITSYPCPTPPEGK